MALGHLLDVDICAILRKPRQSNMKTTDMARRRERREGSARADGRGGRW